MRDIALTAFILVGLVFALKRPWLGVVLWTWVSLMTPHRMTFGFAYNLPYAQIIAGVFVLSLFVARGNYALPWRSPTILLILFVLWMGLTTAFAMFPGESFDQFWKIIKIQIFTLAAMAVIRTKEEISAYVAVNAASIGFFGIKGGLFTLVSGGGSRVWGAGGFIEGNNEVGLAMIMVIPLIYYFFLQAKRAWQRWALLGAMLLTGVSVLGTHSRGALLGLACMGVLLWWRGPKKLHSALAIAVVAGVAISFMPASFTERMATIKTYGDDTSAVSRIYAWQTAINVANDRPLGAGYAMYVQSVTDRYGEGQEFEGLLDAKVLQARAAHSIYFQVLGEHGWVGLALFLLIFLVTWRLATRLRKRAAGRDDLKWVVQLAGMCQVALVGYAAGGAFLSLAYFDLPYNIMVIVVVLDRWVAAQAAPAPRPSGMQPAA